MLSWMIRERQRNNRHDLNSKTTSREMSRTKCGHLHDLVDLTKAFDTDSRDGLWKILVKVWLSTQIHFHDDMPTRVKMMESILNHLR